MRERNEHYTANDIAAMSLTEIAEKIRKGTELKNLVYFYNTSRQSESEPCVYFYEGGDILHPSEGFKYSLYFEKRGETNDETPPVVRFNGVPEVRTFIITLLSLRNFKPKA